MRWIYHRRFSAEVLLFIFVSMLTFSSLHVHEESGGSEGVCLQCMHHLPHGGHWTLASTDFHACVLCQFVNLPYLVVPLLMALLPSMWSLHLEQTGVAACHFLQVDKPCLRAPPFILS